MSFVHPARALLPRPLLVALTGASGAGKTTVAQHVRRLRPALPVFGFDDIGIPDFETMRREHGSELGWQRATIGRWMRRLRESSHPVAVLEGQMMVPFLAEVAGERGAPGVVALMLDCDDAMRFERLRVRGTPHQIGNAVVARAEQFRQHAAAAGVPVLNTCRMPFGSVVRTVLAHCEHGPRPILHRKAFHSRHRAAFAWLF
ncbi:AAA family ATPase [Paracoccus aeridis]|uniref:AAA family ATPase n=1 Tax=Paracoccus aeridis TaxID=1966466 RepID=UPI0010AA27DF|nr:AAA family ATPase [Paracoccus aeridis]